MKHPPRVTSVLGPVVRQARGHRAVVTCRVESTPVPLVRIRLEQKKRITDGMFLLVPTQISWYKIDPSSSSPPSSGDAPRPTLSTSAASSRRRQLRPGSDGVDISIHDYSDGLVSSSVSVPAVGEGDYGTYRWGEATAKRSSSKYWPSGKCQK